MRPFLSRSLPELQQDQLALSLDSRVSKLFVSFQLVCGAVQLHSLGFFHGNICPQNVLLDPSGFAFLSDAASSRCCVQVSQKEVFEASAAGLQALEVAPPGALRLAPEMCVKVVSPKELFSTRRPKGALTRSGFRSQVWIL